MARELVKIVELDASPEQVWHAIATGPGISAWFVPHQVEGRVGGAMTAQFGGGFDVTGRVRVWDEGRRFAYGAAEPPPDGAADYAFEFLVEGREGGGTVLRFVQSGFSDEGWENEYPSYDAGWELFFSNLRSYLTHFAGQPVHNVVTIAFAAGSAADVWPRLYRALGLTGRPALGDTATLAPDGPEPITGVVDVAGDAFLGLRSTTGLHRIGAEGDAGCAISAYHYFYGSPVDTGASTAAWQKWLADLFPAPEPASSTA
ncbi:MAG TPA: SRPBCC domain-containing protein [Dermatophilaceae bacterium]|nr:SRPBCC domain-containing protein [Dermatophilaceae bacterium]